MEKYIPYEKLSKKEKKKRDAAQRGTWGELNPVTRKPKNSRAYDRRKAQNWRREDHGRTDSVPSFLQKSTRSFRNGCNTDQIRATPEARAASATAFATAGPTLLSKAAGMI